MTSIVIVDQTALEPGRPLWQRVPTRDSEGRYLSDFMMLIPKVGSWPDVRRQQVYLDLESVFSRFNDSVVFADLNLKLNLLWVSMRPGADGCLPLAAAVKELIPEAMLVASQAEAMAGMARAEKRRRWGLKLLR